MALSPYLSMIKFSNQKTKWLWIKKQDSTISCLQETHFPFKNTHSLKVKGQKKIFHANVTEGELEWLHFYQTK